MIAIEFSQLLI